MKYCIILLIISILLSLLFDFAFRKHVNEGIKVFSEIYEGMAKDRVIDLITKTKDLSTGLSWHGPHTLHISWLYTHRPPAYLIVVFENNNLKTITLVNADSEIEFSKIIEYLGAIQGQTTI